MKMNTTKRLQEDDGSIIMGLIFSIVMLMVLGTITFGTIKSINASNDSKLEIIRAQSSDVARGASLSELINAETGAGESFKLDTKSLGTLVNNGQAIEDGKEYNYGQMGRSTIQWRRESAEFGRMDECDGKEVISAPETWKMFKVDHAGSTEMSVSLKIDSDGLASSNTVPGRVTRGCYNVTGFPSRLIYEDSDEKDNYYGSLALGPYALKGFALFGSNGVKVDGVSDIDGHIGSSGTINLDGGTKRGDHSAEYVFINRNKDTLEGECIPANSKECRNTITIWAGAEIDDTIPGNVSGLKNEYPQMRVPTSPQRGADRMGEGSFAQIPEKVENRSCFDGENGPVEEDFIASRDGNSIGGGGLIAPKCYRNVVIDAPVFGDGAIFVRGEMRIEGAGKISGLPTFYVMNPAKTNRPAFEYSSSAPSEAFFFVPRSECTLTGVNLTGGVACPYIRATNSKVESPIWNSAAVDSMGQAKINSEDKTAAGDDLYYTMKWMENRKSAVQQ